MSIFKDTFRDYVRDQLSIREKLIEIGNLTDNNPLTNRRQINDIFLQTLESNPLSIDYAPRQAQGRAYSLNSMGMNLGVIVGAGLFVSLIKYFELATHYKLIYFISGMIVVAFSLLTPFLIIEPPDLK